MDDPSIKEFIDREIRHAHTLTNEKFNSRDEAIKLLRDQKKDSTGTYIALAAAIAGGLGLLLAAIGIALQLMKGH